MLIIHNLKAGWRNILKYKVQNTISVLCLSVGVICFAISLYFINVLWQNVEKKYFQDNRVECSIQVEGRNIWKAIDLSDIEKIKKLNSVEDVIYRCHALYTEFILKHKTVPKINSNFGFMVVSPNWLEDNNFRSAVTDKKIGRLKPGTLVMDETLAKRLYGEENFKAGVPIGAKILNMKKQRVVSDVVYSTSYVGLRGYMYLVADQEAITEGHETYDIDYILKDGVKAEQFESEMKELFPGHTLQCWYYTKDSMWISALLIFLVFLGASVLIIGISGYLKMQLQLFMLRSREMSLRRCNGAKPYQLFMLLCSEILIVFCIIAIMSILLTIGFEEYAMPLLQKFRMTDQLDIHTDVIYCTEIHIIIITFLSALGIAWLTVRKSLKSPLSKTVGRSYTQHTLWNGSMQVVQYLVTTILFFVIAFVSYFLYTTIDRNYQDIDTDYYKNVIITYSDKEDETAKLPSVKLKAECRQFHEYIPTKEDSIITKIIPRNTDSNDTINCIRWSMVDAEYFKICKQNITEKPKDEHAINPPIFVSASEADSIKNILSIKHKTSDELHTLADGNEYVIIGYVPYRRIGLPNSTDYYLIKDYGKWQKETEHPEHNTSYTLLILPKDNDADKYNAEYNEMLHRKHKDMPSDYEYKNMTVYDASFMELQIVKFVIQLLYILTITSIVCIIMTIYSSISLETRGKQKDVAIRKVNGAKTHDIVMLFSRYYIATLSIAFTIALLIGIAVIVALCLKGGWNIHDEEVEIAFKGILMAYFGSIFTITLVTTLTVWQKIYKISHINPALLIKKE